VPPSTWAEQQRAEWDAIIDLQALATQGLNSDAYFEAASRIVATALNGTARPPTYSTASAC
jgi:hypothetical protein